MVEEEESLRVHRTAHTHNMNTRHFNAGRYIILCEFVLYTNNATVSNILYSANVRVRERKSASKFVAYIGMPTNTYLLLCTGDEKQKKNTSSHYPYTKPFVVFCVRRRHVHTHTYTHTLLPICNKTTTPAF